MPLLLVKHEENNRAKVEVIHYRPDLLDENTRNKCIEVDRIPEPEEVKYKIPILYINPETKDMWYEYVDRPLTSEEKTEQLEQAMIETSILLAELEHRERLNQQAILELSMLLAEGGNK